MSLGKLKTSVMGGGFGRHWSSSKDVNRAERDVDINGGITTLTNAEEDSTKKMPETGRSYGKLLRTLRRKLPWNSARSCGTDGDVDKAPSSINKVIGGTPKGTSGRGTICPMSPPIISSAAHHVLRRLGVTKHEHSTGMEGDATSSTASFITNGEQNRTVIARRQSVDVIPQPELIGSRISLVTSTDNPSCIDYMIAQYDLRMTPQLTGDAFVAGGGGLTVELFRLAKYGWYWGPITRGEAEEKLTDQTDGAFLVRDSSDDRYLLSLSFRSFGKTLHTRIEHCNGMFSFYAQPESEGHDSIVGLIEHSMSYSQSGVFCYSRARTPGAPSYPVRLTKPVSRFMEVRSLQYLCRFVIRQYTRVDLIQELPLPTRIRGYIEEGHY